MNERSARSISDHVEELGFSVVRSFIGYGVGRLFR